MLGCFADFEHCNFVVVLALDVLVNEVIFTGETVILLRGFTVLIAELLMVAPVAGVEHCFG
jgi:hypothetical protein